MYSQHLQDADDAWARAKRWEVRAMVGYRQAIVEHDRIEGEFKIKKGEELDGVSPSALKVFVQIERGKGKSSPLGAARRRVLAWEALYDRAQTRTARLKNLTYSAAREG